MAGFRWRYQSLHFSLLPLSTLPIGRRLLYHLYQYIMPFVIRRVKSESDIIREEELIEQEEDDELSTDLESNEQNIINTTQLSLSLLPSNKISGALEQWDGLIDREEQYASSNGISQYLSNEKRQTFCTWAYPMIDVYDLPRRVIPVALYYFEKYLTVHYERMKNEKIKDVLDNNDLWRLAVTCICLAIKLHSTRSEESIQKLLLGIRFTTGFSLREVVRTESNLFELLSWYLHPPMPSDYLEVASPLLEEVTAISKDVLSRDIYQLSNYLLQISLFSAEITMHRPSSVAYASVLVSMNYLCTPTIVVNRWREINLKHSQSTRTCIPLLQDLLVAVMKKPKERNCTSPKTVGEL